MNVTENDLDDYLWGSLHYSGIVHQATDISRGLRIYRTILGNGHYHLPFFLVLDLLLVLERGYEVRFSSEANRKENEQEIDTKLVMRYERECLGRLLQSSDLQSATEIASTSTDRSAVTERLLLQIINCLGPHFPNQFMLNPGLLREFQLPENPGSAGKLDLSFQPLLETFLRNLNNLMNWDDLLFEEDLFELAHLENLSTDHLRVGCRQILEASRLLRSPDLLQLDLSSHEDGADTQFLDETHYPSGGLAGLTNRGSFENLLTSELVYLDEGTKDISLFELRFAEGELLFYLRDSGILRRKRRSIHFILDVADIFESKLPGYRWQYSVLLQGICLRLLHDLFSIFEMDALRFHFHYLLWPTISDSEREFFEGEIGVMKTVLADYVKHGWVTFETQTSISLHSLVDPKRKTYAVVLASPGTEIRWSDIVEQIAKEEFPLHCALLEVDRETTDQSECDLPRSGLEIEEITARKNGVLERLVS